MSVAREPDSMHMDLRFPVKQRWGVNRGPYRICGCSQWTEGGERDAIRWLLCFLEFADFPLVAKTRAHVFKPQRFQPRRDRVFKLASHDFFGCHLVSENQLK